MEPRILHKSLYILNADWIVDKCVAKPCPNLDVSLVDHRQPGFCAGSDDRIVNKEHMGNFINSDQDANTETKTYWFIDCKVPLPARMD